MFTFYEGSTEMLIASYLNTVTVVNYTVGDLLSNMVGYAVGVVILTIIPAVYLYLVCISTRKIKSKKTISMFGKLYDELRYWNKPSLFYCFVYLLRRVIYIYIFFNKFL
jgi:hypothetical protein